MTIEATTPHGIRLRRLRRALDHSQVTLSATTGISQAAISKYEHGMIPRADDAIRIARALGTTVEFLWGDAADHNRGVRP